MGVFRVAVCTILLLSPEWWQGHAWATVPAALRFPPEGLGWAMGVIPISPFLARVAEGLFALSAPLALIGLFTRAALGGVVASGLYLFGLRQLTGSVLHDMHLLWFAAMLAASPSGEALSVDALRARQRGRPLPSAPSEAYAWPLACARVSLGLVYFFPGAWKLASSGLAWALSDNLRNQMYWKWYELDWVPALRLDQWPSACRACALGVIVFELGFLPLAIFPRTRPFAAAAGILFHVGTQALMGIPFFGLWGCYVVLFDWGWLIEPPETTETKREPLVRPPDRSWILGVAIIVPVIVQGVRGAVQAWPFACYPTFQWRVGTEIPDVVMSAVYDDRHEARLPRRFKSQAGWSLAWSVVGASGHAPSQQALRAYWDRAARDPKVREAAANARAIRFARGYFSVLPEDRGQPPVREEPVGMISLRP